LEDPSSRISSMLDKQMLDRIRKFCLDVWSLQNPDSVDMFSAWRILKIQDTGNPDIVLSFDDFCASLAGMK
jgi:hypothetical protein